jgi:hypothetical protein
VLEILELIKTLLQLAGVGGARLRAMLIQPVLTVLIIAVLFVGWHVLREANLRAGLHAALYDTEPGREVPPRTVELAIAQADLRQLARSDRLITQLLESLLRRAPTAARTALGVIHNGVTGLTGIKLMRFDLVHTVVAPGRLSGPKLMNEPLSEWEDRLPFLLQGQCYVAPIGQERNDITRARLEGMGAAFVLACPVTGVRGALLGSVALIWDNSDPPPTGEELRLLTRDAKAIGAQIASVLDLRASVALSPDAMDAVPGMTVDAAGSDAGRAVGAPAGGAGLNGAPATAAGPPVGLGPAMSNGAPVNNTLGRDASPAARRGTLPDRP